MSALRRRILRAHSRDTVRYPAPLKAARQVARVVVPTHALHASMVNRLTS
jgi:hypothetical protein